MFYVPCSESKTMTVDKNKVEQFFTALDSGDKKVLEKIEKTLNVDEKKAVKRIAQTIKDEQDRVKLEKNLTPEQSKKLEETDKIITKVETNLIDNENSNLDIIKNLSVDLKDILPLNKMYEGTNFTSLKEYSFNNPTMLRFTNKVLVYLFGKNADTIQRDNPLYFKALRDTTPSIILELMHGVIINRDCFSVPTGRKPKKINFNFNKIYRYVKKPKNVSDDISAKNYFNSKFNKDGKPNDYISFELFNDISKFILMNVEQAEGDVPLLKLLNAINTYIDAGNSFYAETQVPEQIKATKECIYNLLDVATNSNKFDVLLNTLIDITDESNSFKEFKNYIKSFESKSVKIKMYQAVKFDGTKVKYLQADTSENLIKQFKFV